MIALQHEADLGRDESLSLEVLLSLDKVLRLAQPSAPSPDASDLVRLAGQDLERIAVLLARKSDPDNDGDNDATAKGDTDHDFWTKGGKKKKPLSKGKKKSSPGDDDEDEDDEGDDDVEACRSLVLEALVALSQVEGGELLSLSVLTQAEREKPSAHTIPGSTDYPIPDEAHLSAAVARYKQGKYAGHEPAEVAAHIRKHARRLGKQVDLSDVSPSAGASAVIALARGGVPVAMDHEAMTGTHSHPHRVMNVHDHEHTHNGDSRHACGAGGIYSSSVY